MVVSLANNTVRMIAQVPVLFSVSDPEWQVADDYLNSQKAKSHEEADSKFDVLLYLYVP